MEYEDPRITYSVLLLAIIVAFVCIGFLVSLGSENHESDNDAAIMIKYYSK